MDKYIIDEGIEINAKSLYKTREKAGYTILDTTNIYRAEVLEALRKGILSFFTKNKDDSLGILLVLVDNISNFEKEDLSYGRVVIRVETQDDGKPVLLLITDDTRQVTKLYKATLKLFSFKILGLVSFKGYSKQAHKTMLDLLGDVKTTVFRGVVSCLSKEVKYDLIAFTKKER